VKLSRRELIYLVAVRKYNDQGKQAKLSWIARDLKISPASAFEELQHLEKKGFIEKKKEGISITETGIKAIEELVRAHRILEYLLVEMGFSKDEACQFTREFDFAVPKEIIDKLYEYLGKPGKCPHGETIPSY